MTQQTFQITLEPHEARLLAMASWTYLSKLLEEWPEDQEITDAHPELQFAKKLVGVTFTNAFGVSPLN